MHEETPGWVCIKDCSRRPSPFISQLPRASSGALISLLLAVYLNVQLLTPYSYRLDPMRTVQMLQDRLMIQHRPHDSHFPCARAVIASTGRVTDSGRAFRGQNKLLPLPRHRPPHI